MINSELNEQLKGSGLIFNRYLALIKNKNLSIPDSYQDDAEKAQIAFLRLSMSSVLRLIARHSSDSDSQNQINGKIEQIKQALENSQDKNTKRCIHKLEKAADIYSTLCH